MSGSAGGGGRPRGADAALVARLDVAITAGRAVVEPIWREARPWRRRAADAVAALLGFLDEDPELVRLWLLVVPEAEDPAVRERRRLVDEAFRAAIAEGMSDPEAVAPEPGKADWVLRTVLVAIERRVREPGPPRLRELAGAVTALVWLPSLSLGEVAGPLEGAAAPPPGSPPAPRPPRRTG